MELNLLYLKLNLGIEAEDTTNDLLCQQKLDVATEMVLKYLPKDFDVNSSEAAKDAIIMLATHLFTYRNMVSNGQPNETPYAYEFLLNPIKELIIN